MVREKVASRGEESEVVYNEERWRLLREKRSRALQIMRALSTMGLESILHGSLARGDVHPRSDIDVFIVNPTPSYKVELALERAGERIHFKRIVQATPSHHPKVYYFLDPEEKVVVSHPISRLGKREVEFYYFGGALDRARLESGARVPGVDKRLMLIKPTRRGHLEESVLGREAEVARLLGISIDTVEERVRVLSRRDRVGRTGVFINLELAPEESVEEAVKRLASRNPAFRRNLES